jgi:hypothetical protein
MKEFDNFFFKQEEPNQSCLLALRELIIRHDSAISTSWKYGMPFFCYKNKMLCYLWIHKKHHLPYIGFVDGIILNDPDLLSEKRARMKILLIDPNKNIPLKKINSLLKQSLQHRNSL